MSHVAGPAGRRGADAHLRRARPAPGLQGRVFYGKDAFEGLRVLDRLGELRRGETTTRRSVERSRTQGLSTVPRRRRGAPEGLPSRSPDVEDDNPLFMPPFLGSRVAKGMSVDEISEYLNLTALFRNQWGFRPENSEDDPAFKERVSATLREQLAIAKEESLLVPQVVWGHYAAASEGNDLIIFSDDTRTTELTRFTFPRQRVAPFLCIADFFRPVESSDLDYASFMLVTMGPRVSERCQELFAAEPLHRLPHAARPRRRDGRSPRRDLAQAHPRRTRLRGRGRPDPDRALSPAVSRRSLLVGLPGLSRPHRQREGRRTAARATASA